MKLLLIGLSLAAFCGCRLFPARISAPGVSVVGVKDAGKAATLNSDTSVASLPIPEGSRLTVTKWEPVAWRAATQTSPEVQAQPAREVTEIVLSKPTEWRKNETRIAADTGTVDTTLAKHRIDVAENRYLLFAALGAAVAGGFFLYIKYPTPALMCGAASVVFFLAWKLSDLPDWFWVVGVAGIGCGVFLWLGHRRGEQDGVKAAFAGDIEPKNTPVVKTVP